MRIGNVIESPGGGKWIVTSVSTDVVQAVAFDSEGCLATQRLDNHTREEMCDCTDQWQYEPDDACETCHGTGRYQRMVVGWRHSTVLAPTVQAFILNGVKKVWGL